MPSVYHPYCLSFYSSLHLSVCPLSSLSSALLPVSLFLCQSPIYISLLLIYLPVSLFLCLSPSILFFTCHSPRLSVSVYHLYISLLFVFYPSLHFSVCFSSIIVFASPSPRPSVSLSILHLYIPYVCLFNRLPISPSIPHLSSLPSLLLVSISPSILHPSSFLSVLQPVSPSLRLSFSSSFSSSSPIIPH